MNKRIAWNKGLTKETSIGVARTAAAKIGRERSPKTKELLRKARLGKEPWNKGKTGCYSQETLIMMGANKKGKPSPMRGKHFSTEVIEKNRLAQLDNWQDPEYVRKQMASRSKRILTGANNPFFGRHHSPETRERLKQASLNYDKNHPEAISRRLRIQIPNKTELKVLELLGAPWCFVGNGKLVINGKCPDFWNGDHKLVEYWGSLWHKNDNAEERIKHFEKAGYQCLIIQEIELRRIDMLKARIENYAVTGSYAYRSA
jgi:hypothetical protein